MTVEKNIFPVVNITNCSRKSLPQFFFDSQLYTATDNHTLQRLYVLCSVFSSYTTVQVIFERNLGNLRANHMFFNRVSEAQEAIY